MALLISKKRLTELIALTRRAYGEYKLQIVALSVLGLLAGLLEGVGINAIVPLFSFISGAQPTDWLSRQIVGLFGLAHVPLTLNYLLLFITILFFLKAPLVMWTDYIRVKIAADYENKTKARLFAASLNSSWPFLLTQKSGKLETIMLVDVPATRALLANLSSSLTIFASLLVYFLVAINNSSSITLLTLVLGGLVLVFSKPLFRKSFVMGTERVGISREVAHHVSENLFGIKSLKTGLGVGGAIRRGREYFQRLMDIEIRSTVLKSFMRAFMQPLAIMFIAGLFVFTYKSRALNFAAVAVTIFLIDRIFIYLQQLLNTLHSLNDLVPHLRAVLKDDGEIAANQEKTEDRGGDFVFQNSLTFRDLSFAYLPDRPVLRHLNFNVRKGEMVGIVGPSGGGKTTLVDIILRLLLPKAGQILLDGRSIFDIRLSEWRKKIGYVAQDIFLMNASIRDNIRFYDEQVSDEQIAAAAKQADIFEFVQGLPQGFDSIIGERGLMLSAGQRQRIVIARILARKPEILVLDEATSALDNESEAQVQSVIRGLKGRITVLAIAHRLSTVMDSDKLIVLENGELVEQGAPEQLLRDRDSYFFRAYNVKTA